jgi:hypothetical protein
LDTQTLEYPQPTPATKAEVLSSDDGGCGKKPEVNRKKGRGASEADEAMREGVGDGRAMEREGELGNGEGEGEGKLGKRG